MMDIDLLKSLFRVGGTTRSFEIITNLLELLGNPQHALPPVIHITGTNGKGSTTAFLYAALTAAGYRVHRLTSPHLCHLTERIVVANTPIREDALEFYLREMAEKSQGEISFLEALTASALCAFSQTPADIALVEVGVGGLWDGTNVVSTTCASVITPISMDHQKILGPTLGDIALQKSGIMRPGIPCISAPQGPQVQGVLTAQAQRLGSPLFMGCVDWDFRPDHQGVWVRYAGVKARGYGDPRDTVIPKENGCSARTNTLGENGSSARMNTLDKTWDGALGENGCSARTNTIDKTWDGAPRNMPQNLGGGRDFCSPEEAVFFPHIGLVGAHQRANAALAAMTLHTQRVLSVPLEALRWGFSSVCWPGRLQKMMGEKAPSWGKAEPLSPKESPHSPHSRADRAKEESGEKKGAMLEKDPSNAALWQDFLHRHEVWMDGAHNEGGFRVLAEHLIQEGWNRSMDRPSRKVRIQGISNPKDCKGSEVPKNPRPLDSLVSLAPPLETSASKPLVVVLGILPRKNFLSFWHILAPLAQEVWVVEAWGKTEATSLEGMRQNLRAYAGEVKKSGIKYGQGEDEQTISHEEQEGGAPGKQTIAHEEQEGGAPGKQKGAHEEQEGGGHGEEHTLEGALLSSNKARAFASLEEAMEHARCLEASRFLLCGSLHWMGHILRQWEKRGQQHLRN